MALCCVFSIKKGYSNPLHLRTSWGPLACLTSLQVGYCQLRRQMSLCVVLIFIIYIIRLALKMTGRCGRQIFYGRIFLGVQFICYLAYCYNKLLDSWYIFIAENEIKTCIYQDLMLVYHPVQSTARRFGLDPFFLA